MRRVKTGACRTAPLLLLALALVGWVTLAHGPAGSPATRSVHAVAQSLPSLTVAEREASYLGSVAADARVSFTLSLPERDGAGIEAVLAAGGGLTPDQWASRYGPAPSLVDRVRAQLAGARLSSRWAPGGSLLTVSGSAKSVGRFLHVAIGRFALGDRVRFYAPLSRPTLPASVAGDVAAIVGPDDYPAGVSAIPSPEYGVTPKQMTNFYDLGPLRSAGLDGSGITVLFPEGAMPDVSTLTAFAAKFKLPPFDVTVRTNPGRWGAPATPSDSWYANYAGEVSLDLEIVHGLAPRAREVVYVGSGQPSGTLSLLQAMISAYPGAILSASTNIGNCEQSPDARATAVSASAIFAQAAAEGTTIFFASGDRGAFECIFDQEPSTAGDISVYLGADSPDVTAVGGTTSFLATNGAYYKEAAWGEPLETWGSGGGISTIFQQPSWQVAPGLGAASLGGRGVPDVACNGDIVSGWDVFSPPDPSQGEKGPQEYSSGGTSAATPCWAAITALIDEDLTQQGLPKVGFANPALYYFSRDPAGLPAMAFHQVTEGSNLHYEATPGWNAATGLGTPDAAHLADDFEWYDRGHPA